MKKVLITGATGYVGRRLFERLSARQDVAIRLLVRNSRKISPHLQDNIDIIEGDTFDPEILNHATEGIDTAYYLIHSMGAGEGFQHLDKLSAQNFRDACIRSRVKRIVYLGGLGSKKTASNHLLSRIETGEILSSAKEIQTIYFRAGVIIGSGSAGFEIVRSLVQKLPVMITPRWVNTKTQPISIKDVIAYLSAVLDMDEQENIVVDIGSNPMDFREMMMSTAKVMGLRRYLIPVPFLSPRLSSYWLILFTQVPYKIASALVEGLKSETLVLNDNARKYFPDISPLPFDEAVTAAIREMEQDQVISRWCDSSAGNACDVFAMDDPKDAILHDRRIVSLDGVSQDAVFRSVCSVGGKHGWYRYNFLWQLRGFLDKIVGGYGLSRGKRTVSDLRVGDALDFWKVADIRQGKRLLLLAQMKLPGRAWLEFEIHPDRLIQTAHFSPKGIWGRMYWYSVWPLHNFVFADLARQIVANAVQYDNGDRPAGD